MASSNNPVYYNAALAGFLEGALSLGPGNATNGPVITAAQAYATAVDAAIAVDATVSSAANVTRSVTATSAEANAMATRPLALQGFCRAQIQAYGIDPTGGDYAALVTLLLVTWGAYVTANSNN